MKNLKPETGTELTLNNRPGEPDRISFFADKYGVSRNTVLIAMSITGPDEALLEKLLRENRFTR